MLWTMLYNHHINICYYLLDYLVSIVKKKPNDKGDIMVGGIITFLARKFGVSVNQGIKRIEGNYYLDLYTILSFLRTHDPTHNYQYEWRICLIILSNSDITNPEVVENLLYVGTNPQVHNDGDDDGNEEEVGANLHHEQETGGSYNDERRAWMQTKVQRISTEQQR
jgi:hypothetical protein